MRTRGFLFVLLGLTIAGAGTGEAVAAATAHTDKRDLAHAQATARQLTAPVGVVTSTECHGDGLISCWSTQQSVAAVTSYFSAEFGRAAASPACQHVASGIRATPLHADECLVAARYGHHGAFVFVTPGPTHDANGQLTIANTLITVSAS